MFVKKKDEDGPAEMAALGGRGAASGQDASSGKEKASAGKEEGRGGSLGLTNEPHSYRLTARVR